MIIQIFFIFTSKLHRILDFESSRNQRQGSEFSRSATVLHGDTEQHLISWSEFSINKIFKLYVDLPGYLSPCIVTGDILHPGMILVTGGNYPYVLELTVGIKLKFNRRNEANYRPLLEDPNNGYRQVNFVNDNNNNKAESVYWMESFSFRLAAINVCPVLVP